MQLLILSLKLIHNMDGKEAFLVHSGCYNRVPWAGGLKMRHFFRTVLEIRQNDVKVQADLASGEGLLSGSQTASFLLLP